MKNKVKIDAVIEALGDAVSIQDTDYTIRFQNQAHKDLTGDHLGEYCYEAYNQSKQICEECPLKMSFEDGKTHASLRTVTIDDSILHVEITASPLRDPSGDIVGGVEVVRDVTGRRRAEEDRREASRTLQALIEHSPLAVVGADLDINITIWNPAAERIFGWRKEEVIGRANPIVPEDKRDEYIKLVEDMKQGKVYRAKELKRMRKDGALIDLSASLSALRNGSGEVIGLMAMFEDITERLQAEEALWETSTRLQTLIDAIPDMVFFKDAEGRHLLINKACERFTGHSLEEVQGKTMEDMLPPELAEQCRRSDEELMRNKKPVRTEEPAKDKDGNNITLDTIKVPLYDENGNAIGLVGVARDITERKRSEELINASLREKEVLLREIHHRVKNNMQIVSSLLKLQARYAGHGELAGMLRDSQERIKFMALVHEKLYMSSDFSCIDYKDYLRSLTGSLMHISRDTTAKVSITLELEDDFTLGIDTAIPVGLLINELVSNALKHAFPGGGDGEITIAMRRIGENDIELVIRDNGVGMPKGIDIRNSKSMGLMLVSSLSETLGRPAPGRDGDEQAGGDGVYSQV
jgi:PAS domain S-box-containing protein